MKGTNWGAAGECRISGACRVDRPIGVELHDGVDLRIDSFDPAKVRFNELLRGDVAIANEARELGRRAKAQIFVAGCRHGHRVMADFAVVLGATLGAHPNLHAGRGRRHANLETREPLAKPHLELPLRE